MSKVFFYSQIVYNNAKNASIGHMAFEFNCKYHSHVFFRDKVDPHFKSPLWINWLKSLKYWCLFIDKTCFILGHCKSRLMIWAYNLAATHQIRRFGQWQIHQDEQIPMLGAKYFMLFRVFYLVSKQAYKLELPIK